MAPTPEPTATFSRPNTPSRAAVTGATSRAGAPATPSAASGLTADAAHNVPPSATSGAARLAAKLREGRRLYPETAERERMRGGLAAEVARLAADPADRAERARVMADMDAVTADWPE